MDKVVLFFSEYGSIFEFLLSLLMFFVLFFRTSRGRTFNKDTSLKLDNLVDFLNSLVPSKENEKNKSSDEENKKNE